MKWNTFLHKIWHSWAKSFKPKWYYIYCIFIIFYLFNKTKVITLHTKIKLLEINTFLIKKVHGSHGPPLHRHNTERSYWLHIVLYKVAQKNLKKRGFSSIYAVFYGVPCEGHGSEWVTTHFLNLNGKQQRFFE